MLGCAALLAGCKREQPGATVEKIKDQPAKYYGQEVPLTGEVDKVFGPRAFELESNDLIDDQILVLSRSDVRLGDGTTVRDDQRVKLTGTVRPMAVTEIERELGWDLDPQLELEFKIRPVLIARSLAVQDRPELSWAQPATPAISRRPFR